MKFLKLAIVITTLSTLIFSCTKDEVQYNNIVDQNLRKSLETNIKVKIVRNLCDGEGILSFKDKDDYLATMKELQELTLQHTKDIKEQIGAVTTEEYFRIYEEKGFNDSQVLLNFSEMMRFNSLFTDLYHKEEAWLENGGIDIKEDPDNHFVSDAYERVLFNTNSEVIVGDEIYKKLENGHLIISDLNFDMLCLLRGNADLLRLPKGVEFVGDLTDRSGKRMAVCDGMERDADFEYSEDEDYRIKWIIEINTPFFGHRNVKAITKNYFCKKKKNEECKNWKKTPSYTESTVSGSVSGVTFNDQGEKEANCDTQLSFGSKKATGTAKKVVSRVDVDTKTRSGWISGEHRGIAGITYNSTLTWTF